MAATVLSVTGIAAIVVVSVFLMFVLFLSYLHYRNRHHKPVPLEAVNRSKIVKYATIFIVDIALEVVGFVFTVFEAIQIETFDWGTLDMSQIRIAFYLFQSLKYVLLLFCIFSEHVSEELDDKITYKLARLGVRSDWKEVLEGLIMIPNVVIDGMLLNAEYLNHDFGTFFDEDGVILATIDIILWIKLCIRLLLHQYSRKGNPPYQVKQFAYALLIFFYSVLLVFLYVAVHTKSIRYTGMTVTPAMMIVLINALTHTYICSYCSMMSPGILMLDAALRGSDARVQQLKIFIRFLQRKPIPVFFTLGFFAYSIYLYVSILTISLDVAVNFREEELLQGLIYTISILVDIWTVWFFANLGYAFLKRAGGYLGINRILCIPFPDCSSYAQQINAILGQCTANFRLDSRGQMTR